MIKRSVWKMNRLDNPVLLQTTLRQRRHAALVTETMRLWLQRRCDSGYRDDADCGRRYLDIKKKRALGIYKNRYACVL